MAPVATTERTCNVKFPRKHVILCCLGLDSFSKCTQFVICAAGIMTVFLGYGYTQELMFHVEGFKPYGFYLTFVQFVLYSIFSFVERKIRKESGRTAPLQTHLLLSVLTVGTIGLSNAALGYLNYPTQVLFKCCKLIPVLLGGVLIQGKQYKSLDLLAALLMSIGLAAFILTDSKVSPTFSLIGVAMISTALLFDAIIGNVQEKAMRTHGTPNSEIMIFSYSIGSVTLFFILAAMQNLIPAVKFWARVRLVRCTRAFGSVPSCLQQKACKAATTSRRQPGETIFMTVIAVADNQNI
ncbi:adenosine 3'-phospho 5'-phosphosulfate transporter 2-like isoform X2 [Dermacentor silvarum]|uniref:adenosine 3'-phospho 5'-phosphosulfate transporter 2-like isoform X2 n=1 Tax=Dermacentor silvarum TaxID=543639 RepID=UPI00210177D1|nr:adenosine 3'-phospho 5'-phosphosulfate transporter 2-like isoform X2 [Dermacentor silvarum]XP_049527704.1 adenosine 3'-phospho 5'-phosphosulfate transporter 2-like isoform X2 [Dermacentor silvarum]